MPLPPWLIIDMLRPPPPPPRPPPPPPPPPLAKASLVTAIEPMIRAIAVITAVRIDFTLMFVSCLSLRGRLSPPMARTMTETPSARCDSHHENAVLRAGGRGGHRSNAARATAAARKDAQARR